MLRSTALSATLPALLALSPAWAQDAATTDGGQAEAPADQQTQADRGQADPATAEQGQAEAPTDGAQAGQAPADGEPMEVDASRVLATVNGTDITLGHVVVARRTLPEQFAQLPDEALLPGLVDQLVQQTLLSDALEEEPDSVALQVENEERNLRAAVELRRHLEGAISEEDLRAAYEERAAGQEPSTEWRAAHILVESEEEAREILAELEGGADFADLARARSTGPSGPQGGDLGFFGEDMMVEPFEEAVKGLEPGGVSEPVQTQFGWHVIKLEETRQASAPPFEALAPEIAQELQREAVESHLAELTENAEITREPLEGIDPAALSRAALE